MNRIISLLSVITMVLSLNPVSGQIKNPRNIDFTWLTDTSIHNIDLQELAVVLPKGSFPKIDYPFFLNKKDGLEKFYAHEPVICVEIDGKAKAYPLNMLTTHEISNDRLGGVPILATYCPLCNAGVVFDRRLEVEGKKIVLEFEVSGMLRKSDMVMLDTRTESLWQQFMGEAIVGEFSGTLLEVIPSLIISVEEFFTRYPKGSILSNVTSNERLAANYGNNPYVGYDAEGNKPYGRYFPESEVDSRLPAMERVIDIEVDGKYKIYPFKAISERGVVNDQFRDLDVVFFHSGQTVSVLDASRISESRIIGSVTVFYPRVNGELLTFSKKGKRFVDDKTGSLWDITGKCVKGELEGTELSIVPHSNHFAFAFLAFFPEAVIYE